jgi:hypothetical protein
MVLQVNFLPTNQELFDWRARPVPITPVEPQALRHEQWPPNYNAIYAWRIQQLKLFENPAMVESAKAYYSSRPGAFIMDWMDTYNPKKSPDHSDPTLRGSKWVPFIFFWKQKEFIEFLHECRTDGESGLVEKCRDAGATWLACGYSIWSWLFIKQDAIGWGSRKENLVDTLGDADSIFEKMRLIVQRLPECFIPKGFVAKKHATYMKLINPENGSVITGESGDNIGRGGRKSIYLKDEAQPLDAKILTPSGWSTMAEMKIGDKVIGVDGNSTTVTNINNVGIAPVYRINFSDGTFTECSENHLWTVEQKIGAKQVKTLRTSELIKNYRYISPKGQVQYKYRIPTVKPINFNPQENLPLHPWIVGALIGDGGVGSGCINFTTADAENIVRFASYCPEGTKVSFDKRYAWRFTDSGNRYNKSSKAKNAVKAAGIYGCVSHEKFIPDLYKFASVENRLHLLQGLMDTDGSASGGVASFHTCSEKLAKDVQFIVQSLGGTASINIKPDHRGFRDMYVLHISLPGMNVFALTRKTEQLRVRKHPNDKTIINIQYIRDDFVKCITVDNSDGLYLTDNCIVTHNSAHYARPELIEAALGDNTNTQIDISSVNGLGNVFHRRRENGLDWSPGCQIEKGFIRVFIIDWRDHPEKTQLWYDTRKARHVREGLQHIFAQEVDRDYSASVANTVIDYEWIQAALDAHKNIPWLKPSDLDNLVWSAGLDVADEGLDRNALVKLEGFIARYAKEWGERDPGVSTRNVVAECRQHKGLKLQYDSIGVGAAVKSEYNRLVDEKIVEPGLLQFVSWNAGAAVLNPYYHLIENDPEAPTNGEFFDNFKAQAWWSVRTRFYKTWNAVKNGVVYKPDEIISLDSQMPLVYKLMKELAQPTVGRSAKSLKLIVNKKPNGSVSPNLADGFVMAAFPAPENYGGSLEGTYGNV